MRRGRLIPAIAGLTTFIVLGAGLAANALWSTEAALSTAVRVASFADACASVSGTAATRNLGFESPAIAAGTNATVSSIPGWTSTSIATGTTEPIEIWSNGFQSTTAASGQQFIELNADKPSRLSQTYATTPGQVLEWSLAHRGRAGTDVMAVRIGASASNGVLQRQISTGQQWQRYSGVYTVPAGQTSTTISMEAVSTATGNASIGNFLDDVAFGSGPCAEVAATVRNSTTNGGTSYRAGDTVELTATVSNRGTGPANAATLTAALPAELGYVAGSLTIDGAPRSDAADADTGAVDAQGALTARVGAGAGATAGGSIAPGTTAVVKLRAVVRDAAVGKTVTWAPKLASTNTVAPTWVIDAAGSVSFQAVAAPSVADLRVVAPTIARGAGTATATWTVGNDGPAAVTAAVLRITLPGELRTATANPTWAGAACSAVAGVDEANHSANGALAAGGTRNVGVTVSGTAQITTTPSVTAVVRSEADSDPIASNNSVTSPVAVRPAAPTGLVVAGRDARSVTLNWNAATDPAGPLTYRITRTSQSSSVTLTSSTNSLVDSGLSVSTSYTYAVVAVDQHGNLSLPTQISTKTCLINLGSLLCL